MRITQSLTEGPIGSRLLRFALPILAAGILQSLGVSINSIWIGRTLGEAALAASSNANTVMFLLLGAAFGVAMAATILIAHHVGAGNLVAARRVVGTGVTLFIVLSVGLTAIALVLC